MRILVCNWKDLAHPAAGGAEVYTHEVTRRWVKVGHEVTLFAAAVPGRPAEEILDGVRIVRGGGRLTVYRTAREFYRRQPRSRFELVVDEVNTRPFGAAGWGREVPVVVLVHQVCREIWHHEMPVPVALLGRFVAEPLWLRRCRDLPVLTVSESSRDSLRAYGLRDVTVVPPGVSTRTRPAVCRATEPTIVFVGRLTANKRPADALHAFALLRRELPDARLWILGDGPQRDRLAAVAGAGVRFHGRVDEAERDALLARAHALVVTSVREGWGLVVDEAAAVGTPAVGYDRPGLRDSVPAAGGVLVAPNPAAMAAALLRHLPRWYARPASVGWAGGALDWDAVADRLLRAALVGLDRRAGAGGTDAPGRGPSGVRRLRSVQCGRCDRDGVAR